MLPAAYLVGFVGFDGQNRKTCRILQNCCKMNKEFRLFEISSKVYSILVFGRKMLHGAGIEPSALWCTAKGLTTMLNICLHFTPKL
jgi:hypothetical protein